MSLNEGELIDLPLTIKIKFCFVCLCLLLFPVLFGGVFAQCCLSGLTPLLSPLLGPPGPPGGVRLEEVGEKSVRLIWSQGKDNHSPISKYTIQYKDLRSGGQWREAKTCKKSIFIFLSLLLLSSLSTYLQLSFLFLFIFL